MAKVAEKNKVAEGAAREFRAMARFQRTSPQKAKLVLDTIKGQPVEKALNTLLFTRKRIAPVVEKVLRSAVQNANYLADEQGFDLDVDNLIVKTAVANEGARLKRIRPAPMGRAFRYQRRTAHIVVTLAERKSAGGALTAAPAKKTAAKAGTTKSTSKSARQKTKAAV